MSYKLSGGKHVKENKIIWVVAFLLIILIKTFTTNQLWVERYYSTGFYVSFSKILRMFFGWIPFSFGDILYFFAGFWIVWKISKNVILLLRRELTKKLVFKKLL